LPGSDFNSSCRSSAALVAGSVLVCLSAGLCGCQARQLGSLVSPTKADSIDVSWVIAAKNCWPALRDSSDKYVGGALLDPIGFRGAFPAYASLPDSAIESIATEPVSKAPGTDQSVLRNQAEPVLTRSQATTPQFMADQNNPALRTVTNDTLCVVHPGSPVGFK
jgi:hypothetical protein